MLHPIFSHFDADVITEAYINLFTNRKLYDKVAIGQALSRINYRKYQTHSIYANDYRREALEIALFKELYYNDHVICSLVSSDWVASRIEAAIRTYEIDGRYTSKAANKLLLLVAANQYSNNL